MKIFSRIITSSTILLLVLVLLDITGVMDVSFSLILSFLMMLGGFVLFSSIFGNDRKLLLGTGAAFFFFGLLWFLQNVFHYSATGKEFIIALLMVNSFTLLLLWIEDVKLLKYLYGAIGFGGLGVFLLFRETGFSLQDALQWVPQILAKIWPVFVLLIIYLIAVSIRKEE